MINILLIYHFYCHVSRAGPNLIGNDRQQSSPLSSPGFRFNFTITHCVVNNYKKSMDGSEKKLSNKNGSDGKPIQGDIQYYTIINFKQSLLEIINEM